MAIKLPDPGNGIPEQKTGNDEWTNMQIVRENFSNTTHAASRLVGTATGNVMEVGAFGLGQKTATIIDSTNTDYFNKDKHATQKASFGGFYDAGKLIFPNMYNATVMLTYTQDWATQIVFSPQLNNAAPKYRSYYNGTTWSGWTEFWTAANATKDGNGFLKAASPVVDLYDDKIELNLDAETQGVEFIKNGTGDYTLKTKTGLRSDNTWQIEVPQDNNKNPLLAVDIDAKDDGTINVKCYKRIFSMETFLFGPDFNEPMDINEGRFISVRLNDNPEPEQTDEPAI